MKVFRIWFLCLLVASLLALPLRAPTLTRASNGGFSDVGPDHWAYEAITWLSQQGILTGYPDGFKSSFLIIKSASPMRRNSGWG